MTTRLEDDFNEQGVAAPTIRARLLARFEEWLDNVLLGEEEPPTGVDAELLRELEFSSGRGDDLQQRECDLYDLWSSMTGLTQEVKLQGRTFAELTTMIREEKSAAETQAETKRAAAVEQVRTSEIETLLDLRDRLLRGHESTRRHLENAGTAPLGRLGRLLRGEASHFTELREAGLALLKGYALTLKRLAEALDRLNVREIVCVGEPFDPLLMSAVDVEETRETADGTVLEVYRRGYYRDGELFRIAEVKVARNAPMGEMDE